jgi:hypothetical protein
MTALEIPYTPYYKKIPKYFAKIQEAGIPPKVNRNWLKSAGFTSGNDSYIISVLRFIGFADSSNSPTELWTKYKSPQEAGAILAQAIRSGYSDLFNLYRDANNKDQDTLYAYFSTTGKAKNTVNYMVNTFSNLCALADFKAETPPTIESGIVETPSPPLMPSSPTQVLGKGYTPEIHINIQLHLPATTDPAIYDNLFKSMKKHLLSAE